jgi:hypothetical protein
MYAHPQLAQRFWLIADIAERKRGAGEAEIRLEIEVQGMPTFFFFLAVLGFELRALHLLGRCSTTSPTSPNIFL